LGPPISIYPRGLATPFLALAETVTLH
jgi:hypothetical protein